MSEEEEDDPLTEQVVVAALPGDAPQVHLATLNRGSGTVSLRQASVRAGGDLSLGAEKSVSLAAAGSVEVSDGIVGVLGRDGSLIVQLHLDTLEDQQAWAEGIRSLLRSGRGGGSGGPARQVDGARQQEEEEDTDEDVVLLQARSRQLQNRIGVLEAAGERQDRQVQKMLRRLDGAMQMLTAVQDMCSQQRKVIAAQKDAIAELRFECGDETEGRAQEEGGGEPEGQGAARAGGSQRGGHGGRQEEEDEEEEDEDEEEEEEEEEEEAGDEEESEAKAEEMLRLLQQADQMSRALAALQSGAALPEALPGEAAPAAAAGAGARKAGGRPAASPAAGEGEGTGEEGDEAVLARLMQLQAEKQRFEGMLRDSQQEHEDLLHRLEGMRALMRDLGMPDLVDDSNGDAATMPS